jgi:hypothetical protein
MKQIMLKLRNRSGKEKFLILLGLILAGMTIWYNISVYYAHKTGRLAEGWYLISLLLPLFVLVANFLIAEKLGKTTKTRKVKVNNE